MNLPVWAVIQQVDAHPTHNRTVHTVTLTDSAGTPNNDSTQVSVLDSSNTPNDDIKAGIVTFIGAAYSVTVTAADIRLSGGWT